MDNIDKQITNNISLKEIVTKINLFIAYITQKWRLILLYSFVGALLGFACSVIIKPKYTAVCSFVLDDGDKSSLGQYAALASLAGLSVGDGGGIFKGDNIIELYKSREMIKKTLLSEVYFNKKKEKLIDRYIDFNHLLKKWKENDNIENINFNGNADKFNRKQDSLITDITELFNKTSLTVAKPDKKLSIIYVTFTAKDEFFAKEFTNKLVETVNEFYVQTKTKKLSQNINVLQRQADSVKRSLNNSLSGVANAIDAAPNANPALVSLRVPSQKKQVDVQANTAIYSEIIKNLEISRISLMQQTPLIQLIDEPVFPLTVNRIGKIKGVAIGTFLGLFLAIGVLTVKKLLNTIK